jgi:hypothetical protein
MQLEEGLCTWDKKHMLNGYSTSLGILFIGPLGGSELSFLPVVLKGRVFRDHNAQFRALRICILDAKGPAIRGTICLNKACKIILAQSTLDVQYVEYI